MYKYFSSQGSLFNCDKMEGASSYFPSNWQDLCLIITNRRLNFPALAFPTPKVSGRFNNHSSMFYARLLRRTPDCYPTIICLGNTNKDWPLVCRCQTFRNPRPEPSAPPRTYLHTPPQFAPRHLICLPLLQKPACCLKMRWPSYHQSHLDDSSDCSSAALPPSPLHFQLPLVPPSSRRSSHHITDGQLSLY